MSRRRVDLIVVHCSLSDWGTADDIRRWHRDRGWSDIGYHKVIQNGYPTPETLKVLQKPHWWLDGYAQDGRPEEDIGAHALGFNDHSLGICLIGKNHFTNRQFFSLYRVLIEWIVRYSLRQQEPEIRGHYELKTPEEHKEAGFNWCPRIDMEHLRGAVQMARTGAFPHASSPGFKHQQIR